MIGVANKGFRFASVGVVIYCTKGSMSLLSYFFIGRLDTAKHFLPN
jgi:hypothetical protein